MDTNQYNTTNRSCQEIYDILSQLEEKVDVYRLSDDEIKRLVETLIATEKEIIERDIKYATEEKAVEKEHREVQQALRSYIEELQSLRRQLVDIVQSHEKIVNLLSEINVSINRAIVVVSTVEEKQVALYKRIDMFEKRDESRQKRLEYLLYAVLVFLFLLLLRLM